MPIAPYRMTRRSKMPNLELSDGRGDRHQRSAGAGMTSGFVRRQKVQAVVNAGLVSVAFLFLIAVILGIFP